MKNRPSLRDGHQVKLLQGGAEFFPELIRALDAARSHIQLETYIFDFHGAGALVAAALERAGRRGLRVWVVVDGVGTPRLREEWRLRFDTAGVVWRVYSPLGALGLLIPNRWRRLHRKLCVIDGHVAFCGGINILDDWYDPQHGALKAPRLDFAVCATGALVQEVQEATMQLWWRMQALRHVRQQNFPEAFSSFKAAGLHLPWLHDAQVAHGQSWVARAGLLVRDNVMHRGQIEKAYRRAIGRARADIVIANAYFLPGRKLRQALVHAAQRGVRVKLLLQGRYEYFMQYHAARPVYRQLLAAGVEIYEYSESFLHAKVAVIDAHHEHPWATVGSSNLDPFSLLLAREANVVVADGDFAKQLLAGLNQAIETGSERIMPHTLMSRSKCQRGMDWVAFGLMRLAIWLTGHRY
ncbi:MAG: putative cardiolipin synthase YbhO [Pseudomonadota bacterium]|jgi:cardiolipin synthase